MWGFSAYISVVISGGALSCYELVLDKRRWGDVVAIGR